MIPIEKTNENQCQYNPKEKHEKAKVFAVDRHEYDRSDCQVLGWLNRKKLMLLYMNCDEEFLVYDLERKYGVYKCKSSVPFKFAKNRFFAIHFKSNKDPLENVKEGDRDYEKLKQDEQKLTLLHVF